MHTTPHIVAAPRLVSRETSLPSLTFDRALSSDPHVATSIRARYDQLMRRLRYIATDPVQWLPDNEYLPALTSGALTLAKRVHAELQRSATAGPDGCASRISPTALLASAESLVARYDHQQRILVELKNNARDLCELIAGMPQERPPRYAHLAKLADHIIDQSSRRTAVDDVLPQPGLPVARIAASELPHEHARVYVEAIQAAQLIAWMAVDRFKTREPLRQLVVAGLLRDVGCLSLRCGIMVDPSQFSESERQMFHRHPRLSAAMIGRIYQPPVPIARLVARHHERLDGSGYPARLAGIQFNEHLRILTAADEYITLCRPIAPVMQFVTDPRQRRSAAAAELSAVAERGQLDQEWVARLTGDADHSSTAALPPSHEIQTSTGTAQHRIDPVQTPHPHQRVAAPHEPLAPTSSIASPSIS